MKFKKKEKILLVGIAVVVLAIFILPTQFGLQYIGASGMSCSLSANALSCSWSGSAIPGTYQAQYPNINVRFDTTGICSDSACVSQWISDHPCIGHATGSDKWTGEAKDQTITAKIKSSDTWYKPFVRFNTAWEGPTSVSILCEERQPICPPGNIKCTGNDVMECSADGFQWITKETCAYGCSGAVCNEPSADEPIIDPIDPTIPEPQKPINIWDKLSSKLDALIEWVKTALGFRAMVKITSGEINAGDTLTDTFNIDIANIDTDYSDGSRSYYYSAYKIYDQNDNEVSRGYIEVTEAHTDYNINWEIPLSAKGDYKLIIATFEIPMTYDVISKTWSEGEPIEIDKQGYEFTVIGIQEPIEPKFSWSWLWDWFKSLFGL